MEAAAPKFHVIIQMITKGAFMADQSAANRDHGVDSGTAGETSQTLDRGLTVLSLLATHSGGLSAAQIAEELATARAVVYRLLRTLQAHRLIGRVDSRYVLGIGVAELASRLRPGLQATVLPILRRLSQETRATALLSIADGDEALILLTEEPVDTNFHLAIRQGARHPLDLGSDGIAILAGRPADAADTKAIQRARRRGYAVSLGDLQGGALGLAAPIATSDWATASIGIVAIGDKESDIAPGAADAVVAAAADAAKRLLGDFSTESSALA
ncbi:DNA-binding IclR family transcriptional regulator [Mycobacterium sp. MAA66]|uniref:IclR family transcriptional regulator n=1 Tax=Mycobacterium sp. MAA66 TaxID=3156297 RepID=UPI003516CCC3